MPATVISVGFGVVIVIAGRDRIDDVVAVAERQLQVLAGDRRLVADAADLELPLETMGDAADQVGDPRAGHAPHRAGALVLAVRLDMHGAAVDRHRHLVRRGEVEFALRAFDGDGLTLQLRGDAGRNDHGLLADTRHGSIPIFASARQKTVQRTSPPTLASRAAWSAMTPFGVETIATPRPLATRGMASTVA